MRDYRKIRTWQKADDLAVAVYRLTGRYPQDELYGIISQLRRAGYSVPANIAEGATRESIAEYLHFLYIARSSLTEVEYFIHLSYRLNYITEQEEEGMRLQIKEVFVLLHRLIVSVKRESNM